MKKIFIALILSFVFVLFAYSGENNITDLKSKIEIIERETITFSGENITLDNRLKNAEIYVFGVPKNGDLNSRMVNISKALGIDISDKSKMEPKYEIENDKLANYPAVDKLEQNRFGKIYKNENIYKRLERLENDIFGKISYKNLNDRVNDLQNKITSYDSLKNNESIYSKPKITNDTKDYNYYSYSKKADPIIPKIEQKMWKHTFENESTQKRLSRIEDNLFGQNYENESESNRVERIKSVLKANKSGGEYKVNKFAKYAATGVQVGGLILLILAMIL